MANLNRVLLIGNLTRDPELRVTPKGTAICQFGLAVNRSFKDESGQTREETTFIDIEAWGRQGETISKYCTKGRPLFVEGRLRLDQWEDKASGQKRSRMKVVLENFQFLGGRGEGGPGGAGGGNAGGDENFDQSPERHAPPPRAGSARPATPPPADNLDDDVPF
ncbi:MAG TPA: single-stranded DNA-binding protein [Candidatus Synoicihabitans sp.]|nr:single-stranded DNA-binding protein [Candidatus Synoicihabitans sp.]